MTVDLFDKIFGRPATTPQYAKKRVAIHPNNFWFTSPTLSSEYPRTIRQKPDSAVHIAIDEDDYRQMEFLNPDSLPLIQQEFKAIMEIRNNYSKNVEYHT